MSPLGPQWAPMEEVERLVREGHSPIDATEMVMRQMGRTHFVTFTGKVLRDHARQVATEVKP